MITSSELALVRESLDGAAITGIDTETGNQTATSRLISYTALSTSSSAPIYYDAAQKTVVIQQNGMDLSGYDFTGVTVVVSANNVTIQNSTFGDTGNYSLVQNSANTGLTVKSSTFNGGDNNTSFAAFVSSTSGFITLTGNSFLDAPGDALHVDNGLISGNYIAGGGYAAGAHADAIWVPTTYGSVTITGNTIDWTPSADALADPNNAIRITTEKGNTSNVTVSNNILLGGNTTIDAGSGTAGTYSNIIIKNNYTGFSKYGSFYPGGMRGVTTSGNVLIDYNNPIYSLNAWASYLDAGMKTVNLVTSSGASITGAASGSSTIYGSGYGVQLFGTANQSIFVGGAGSQMLYSGAGQNIFTYLSVGDSTSQGSDLILNFNTTKDSIDLSAIDANLSKAGVQNFTFIGSAAFSSTGGEVRFVQSGNYTLVEATLAGDTTPSLYIRVNGHLNLTAANFELTAAQSATATAAASAVTSVTAPSGSYHPGQTITFSVNFDGAVNVTGSPQLKLSDGGTAYYAGGSGTDTLTFTYTVGINQTSSDLTVSSIYLGSAKITDTRNNVATLTGVVTNPNGVLVIDTTAPRVTSIISGTPNGTLHTGDTVTLTVNFGEVVNVAGTPTLTLNDGGVATYKSGSGTNALTFTYTVAAGQNVADLAVKALSLGSAKITDGAGNAAILTGAVTNPTGILKIDSTAPVVKSVVSSTPSGYLNAGKVLTFTVNLSEAVIVNGTPTLTLNDGGVATYKSGSGTKALTFTYTVAAGQNTADLAVTGVTLASATIKDAAGNNAVLTGAVANLSGLLEIDTIAPTVKSVVSTTPTGDLSTGKVVTLTVSFSEAVKVTGTPALTLNDGGVATYKSGSGTSALTFTYTVAAGQNTSDLTVTGVSLGSAKITDAAGNAVVLPGTAVNPTGILQIDTTVPTVKSVVSSLPTGDLKAGKTITLTVNLSEVVKVTGTPVLKLNDGGVATYKSGSGTSALTFTYTVAAGQNTSDLAVTGLTLGSAKITDGAGNAVALTGAAINPTGVLKIDTTAPTVKSIVSSLPTGDLKAGKSVNLTVNFSEAVSAAAGSTLTMNDGGVATYTGGSGSSALTFTYTVAAGQNTSDLTVTALSSAKITDGAGNAAIMMTAINPTGVLRVDTVAPTVTSVATSARNFIVNGAKSTISLTMSEALTVTGTPSLLLNDGAAATYDSTKSTSTKKVFDYTAGLESTSNLSVVGVEFASGSSMSDLATNTANLAGADKNLGVKVNDSSSSTENFTIANGYDIELFSSSSANISFGSNGSGGLVLDHSQSFSGTVAGLDANDFIDLADVSYAASSSPIYMSNSLGTGGKLSVTDGTHTANIDLIGNYAAATFVASSDGHGGTLIAQVAADAHNGVALTTPHVG